MSWVLVPLFRTTFLNAYYSAEAAIALRQRLNETVEQYETLRKEHTSLSVQFDTLTRELTIAKSDCTHFRLSNHHHPRLTLAGK